MLGTWEWLIVVFLATAATWRFWPKSWRIIPHVRFSVRGLMVAVLVVGLICGGFAHWYARRARRQALIAQLHVQQQVTDSVIHQAIVDISVAGRGAFSVSSGDSFGHDEWTAEVDARESPGGGTIPRLLGGVSGGGEGDVPRPTTIKAAGASRKGPLLDRLPRPSRAGGGRHGVAPRPAADK